jgi:hypothetical protein
MVDGAVQRDREKEQRAARLQEMMMVTGQGRRERGDSVEEICVLVGGGRGLGDLYGWVDL